MSITLIHNFIIAFANFSLCSPLQKDVVAAVDTAALRAPMPEAVDEAVARGKAQREEEV